MQQRFTLLRYLRLYGLLIRSCFIRETMFRTNFLLRCLMHLVWIAVMVGFFEVIFHLTDRIGEWDRDAYLFFLGTSLTLNALLNCIFIGNCSQLSELVRTGNLDFVLLKPVDEQFLISCQRIDWSMIPEVVFSAGLSVYASLHATVPMPPSHVAVYLVLLTASLALLYSLLLMLSSLCIWTVRHQELYEIWFYVMRFASYPPDIYRDHRAGAILGFVLSYLIPVVLAVAVPARYGTWLLESWKPAAYLLVAAIGSIVASRRFLRFALKSYRSASS